jgi:hypothetical protein
MIEGQMIHPEELKRLKETIAGLAEEAGEEV